ncbi:MAG: hypothetical protein CBD97_01210 [Pelagibacteraceae bacterium TMED237]|nr:hypothetical protein [Candidatus Neomarinimicrobiota bacterium]OUW96613.1 MAG: hypothetical protein CBD97_01210 [Pelagibacteraceae bacterium TMED237]
MSKVISNRRNEIVGLILILLGLFVFLSLIPTNELPQGLGKGSVSGCSEPFDYTISAPSDNITGRFGDFVYYLLACKGFGLNSLIISAVLLLWGITLIRSKSINKTFIRSLYLLIAMIFLSVYSSGFNGGLVVQSGQFGVSIFNWLENRLGAFVWISGGLFFYIATCMIFELPIYRTLDMIVSPLINMFQNFFSFVTFKNKIKNKSQINSNTQVIQDDNNIRKHDVPVYEDEVNSSEKNDTSVLEQQAIESNSVLEDYYLDKNESIPRVKDNQEDVVDLNQSENYNIDNIEITEETSIDEVSLDLSKERKHRLFNFKLPPTSILNDEPDVTIDVSEEELRARGQEIIDALASFGVIGEIVGIKKGPVITLYEIEPAEGVRVNKFTNLSDDLARVMKASRIRVLAPIPGSKSVGIELPNDKPKIVYLKNIINSDQYVNSKSKLTIGLGKTTMGEAFSFDLQKMPHLLVAGATGAGKSVCINTIIVSILYKAKPDEVKFILIDPKKLELATYKSLVGYHLITAPDLDEYVMTTVENAVGILDSAISEMERRFDLFSGVRVRNIEEYHIKQKQDSHLEKIPYLVVIIDELADLMMTSGRAVEDPITRLAQKARAVGIHLVVATQRPSVDVITGLIKSNFPARISFQVSSKIDSRTILDQMGAEKLLGRGDMLFLPPGSASPTRIHNAYITLEEIEKLMNHISSQNKPEELLLPERKKDIPKSDFNVDEDKDVLLFDAAKLVIQNQQASVSLLQRKFKIGYSRAGRLVDELEALGIITGYSGSKAREVLVDESYLDTIFN